jgi:hypothetical protein
MEESQLQAPVTLHPEKGLLVLTVQEAVGFRAGLNVMAKRETSNLVI